MNKGLYIAFEGGEGCGKSTQLRILAERLEKMFPGKVLRTREPGGETEAGKMLREFLLDKKFKKGLTAKAEYLIFSAQRAQELPLTVEPALKNGLIVLRDRTDMSSRAYQGEGRGVDSDAIMFINRFAVGGIVPDLILLFKVSPEVGLARKRQGQEWNRFEAMDLGFHDRVGKGFQKFAEEDRVRIKVINGELSEKEVSWLVWQEVELLVCNYGMGIESGRGKER